MSGNLPMNNCISCGRTEEQAPLLDIRFKGNTAQICSSCLPILIHHPDRLAQKLPGSGTVPSVPHRGE